MTNTTRIDDRPRCSMGCGRCVYSAGLCYAHFQAALTSGLGPWYVAAIAKGETP